MATVKAEFEADICDDCLMAYAGISEHERGEEYSKEFPPLSHLVEAGDSFTISQHTNESGDWEDPSFSWNRCDGCNSPLGGDRHSVTVTVWA